MSSAKAAAVVEVRFLVRKEFFSGKKSPLTLSSLNSPKLTQFHALAMMKGTNLPVLTNLNLYKVGKSVRYRPFSCRTQRGEGRTERHNISTKWCTTFFRISFAWKYHARARHIATCGPCLATSDAWRPRSRSRSRLDQTNAGHGRGHSSSSAAPWLCLIFERWKVLLTSTSFQNEKNARNIALFAIGSRKSENYACGSCRAQFSHCFRNGSFLIFRHVRQFGESVGKYAFTE